MSETVWTAQGMTDDVTQCEHCGKPELKGTVRMVSTDGGEIYAGTSCAARLAGKPVREIRAEIRTAERARAAIVAAAEQDARTAAHYATLSTEYLSEVRARVAADLAKARQRRAANAGWLARLESLATAELAAR